MERSTVELMHEDSRRRAYRLIELKQDVADGSHVEDELKGELQRIVYALSRVQECANADVGSDRIHRAARIYLLALSSFAMERRRQTGASVRDAAKM